MCLAKKHFWVDKRFFIGLSKSIGDQYEENTIQLFQMPDPLA